MGKRGPKPTPVAIKRMTGARVRPVAAAISPPARAPTMPDFLPLAARAEWRRMAPRLVSLGLLSEIDKAALILYVECYAAYTKLVGQVAAAEATNDTAREAILHKQLREARADLHRALAAFGLTPADRARVSASHDGELSHRQGDEDPVEAKLSTLRRVL